MIPEEFVDNFIKEIEEELEQLSVQENKVDSYLKSMEGKYDPNVKLDEELIKEAQSKARRAADERVRDFKEKLDALELPNKRRSSSAPRYRGLMI